jgi:hypothetical protein
MLLTPQLGANATPLTAESHHALMMTVFAQQLNADVIEILFDPIVQPAYPYFPY